MLAEDAGRRCWLEMLAGSKENGVGASNFLGMSFQYLPQSWGRRLVAIGNSEEEESRE
jgi:hypothetical protein